MEVNERISGTGQIELQGEITLHCSFDVVQYFDGALEIECIFTDQIAGLHLISSTDVSVGTFTGRTPCGKEVSSASEVRTIRIDGQTATLATNEVTVTELGLRFSHSYLLTNLTFPDAARDSTPASVPLVIPADPSAITVTLAPLPDYPDRARLLRKHKSPVPTAILSFVDHSAVTDVDGLAAEICTALSIVQGHKINWIRHEAMDATGNIVLRHLYNRVTKRYSGLSLNAHSANEGCLPLLALERCFSRMRELQRTYALRPVLEIWLEARTDVDYIETRALKLVTVIEALRTSVLGTEIESTIIAKADWDAFKAHILPLSHAYLTAKGNLNRQEVELIVTPARWEQLNRRSFRSQITKTFKTLRVNESARSVELFINSRNKLIHEGRFRCNSDLEAVEVEPDAPKDQVAEYLFIARFVDRVILQAFGLGSYLAKA